MRVQEDSKLNKGRCFVEFSTRDEAEKALGYLEREALEFKGKLLKGTLGISSATQSKVLDKIVKQEVALKQAAEVSASSSSSSDDEEEDQDDEQIDTTTTKALS